MKLFRLVLATSLALAWQSANAAPYKLIHAFKGGLNDGRTPTFASLTASGNILYGVTLDGGKYTNGVVFKINGPAGSQPQLLHTFNGDSVLNPAGSKFDGAYPLGTPVLDPTGTTLYGMTEEGGTNGYTGGTIYAVNTDGSGFRLLHHFGGVGDGWAPQGSLIISGTTLFGMTSSGGTNFGDDEGTIFTIQTDGTGYKVYHDFTVPGEGDPNGSLLLWGTTLFGMTQGSIFAIETNGASFATIHEFTGTTTDGANAHGSLIRQGGYLYGMTLQGGQNSVGTVFQLEFFPRNFQIIHSFSLSEAYSPYGDLALSGSTLYGITSAGVTNYRNVASIGSGAVFQINTNGSGYQVMHTFEFPVVQNDGSLPFGSPLILGSELYGMASLGGSTTYDGGCIFALTLPAGSAGGGTPPTITTTSPLPNGKVGVAYKQQLEASGGATPYTWAVSEGHLPPGLALSAAGVLSGKPTGGKIAAFSVKVTGHDKLNSSQAFALTVEATPTLTITTPKAAMKVTTPTLTISGTAADSVGGVAGVFFQLNGGAWTPAASANNFTNWNFPNLPLPADADVLSAYAVDSFGNHSKTNTVKFEYYVTGPLIVKTNGSGSFTPPDNGKNFQIGATFAITAKPAKKFIFEDWTDGTGKVLTHEVGLRFVMSSNLTLIANFVPALGSAIAHNMASDIDSSAKPFEDAAGNYAGLFAPSSDMRQLTNSGAIRLTLTDSGLFSGKLNLGSESIPFAGSFDASGASRLIIPRNKTAMSTTLQLDVAHQSITGEVTDGAFIAQVVSYRGGISPVTSSQGTYNLVITSIVLSSGPPLIPTGTLAVDALGNATFTGTLPDGTRATQTSLISTDGYWPLYLPVRSGSGAESSSVWSWNQLTNGTVSSLPAASTWITGTNKTSIQITGTGNQAPNRQ